MSTSYTIITPSASKGICNETYLMLGRRADLQHVLILRVSVYVPNSLRDLHA